MNRNNLTNIWSNVISALQSRLNNPSVDTWLNSMNPVKIINDSLIIEVSDKFSRDWLDDRYGPVIKSILYDILEEEMNVEFALSHDIPGRINNNKHKKNYHISDNPLYHLNTKYTFDTFVVGNSNRFAHAACLAVADSPSKSYNPLFIYGGVGLGKTHLMHAIGNHILSKGNLYNVLYISSEKFTNELINSIRDDKTLEFRNKYRSVDILLIDDIQFLAGKERTQEEFFHTFNTLYEANKQIIISSDRPPKDIPTLEDRLRSRFEWGLITDIQTPDFETRIAILRKKAQLEDLDVPDDILTYIADKIHSNIRELEGALIRIIAFASFNQQEINIELAETVLKDILPEIKPRQITAELIQQVVSNHYNLKPEELKAKKRTRSVSFPRQISMFLTRELTDLSLPKIGEMYGGRDHTTVIHACERIGTEIKINPSLESTINELIHTIKNG